MAIKDINDMIMAGMTEEEVLTLLQENTYSGLEARFRFMDWQKCWEAGEKR